MLEKGEAVCVHDYLGTCMGGRDPSYHTFDGATVDIRGGCAYTLARYCGNDPTLVPFTVEERKSVGDATEGVTTVHVYAYKISIRPGEGGEVQVGSSPEAELETCGEPPKPARILWDVAEGALGPPRGGFEATRVTFGVVSRQRCLEGCGCTIGIHHRAHQL